MRIIEQAEKDCRAAWAAQPEATQGWCIHHGQEWEALSVPIANRIAYILAEKPKSEQVTRLDNMRPMSAASAAIVATAWKAYDEATATAWKAYDEATATAWKAYEEAKATAWKAYDEAKASSYDEATATAWKAYEEAKAPAWKAYEEATAPAWKAHEEAKATAWKAYDEATATAHRADVPTHTWNGKSIFKST
jgi:hypothetical protein